MSHGKLKTFYNSDIWRTFRADIILKRGTTCEFCNKKMFAEDNMQLHHTPIELTEDNYKDVNISMNPDNVKLICQTCHNKAHGRFCGGSRNKRERGIYIVYGPPCSGKSTYVEQHIERGDMVIDMDRLYSAVAMQEPHDKPDNLKYNVFAIKNLLIDNVKHRYGYYNSVWIVGGYPNKVERERLATELGAEIIYIETSEELCIKRLEAAGGYRAKHITEWQRYISEWFEKYTK